MVKILICDPIHEDGIQILEDAGFQVDIDAKISEEELQKRIKSYDAVVVRSRTTITKEIIDSGEKLKAIARAGVGLDNVDLKSANEKGVEVFNSPEAPCNAVAELVLGMLFSLARNITIADASMKEGQWKKNELTGYELQGKTLGIIGFGRIGYTLGKKARCLGMHVITYDVEIDKIKKYVEEINAESVDLDTLYNKSDFISLHVPLLPSTKHMISTNEFEKMRKGAYIINASRGGVINEDALKDALDTGIVKGAALDVFEEEPPKDMNLINRPNVICTPHIGAGSVEAQIGNSTVVAQKLVEFFK